MIDIKQLKCFITCADAGSFSEAASVLYTTQSSVSKVIRGDAGVPFRQKSPRNQPDTKR